MNNYPPNWPEIAYQIKESAGWKCEHCGHHHDPQSGHCLTTHHLDLDKANCAYSNLVALCQKCHLHIQATFRPGQMVFSFARPDWMVKRGLGK